METLAQVRAKLGWSESSKLAWRNPERLSKRPSKSLERLEARIESDLGHALSAIRKFEGGSFDQESSSDRHWRLTQLLLGDSRELGGAVGSIISQFCPRSLKIKILNDEVQFFFLRILLHHQAPSCGSTTRYHLTERRKSNEPIWNPELAYCGRRLKCGLGCLPVPSPLLRSVEFGAASTGSHRVERGFVDFMLDHSESRQNGSGIRPQPLLDLSYADAVSLLDAANAPVRFAWTIQLFG